MKRTYRRHGETRNEFQILVGKPEENKPDGSHRLTRDDDIKSNLKELGYECVKCIHLFQDSDWQWVPVITLMNLLLNRVEKFFPLNF
jgi:hypothetical protein